MKIRRKTNECLNCGALLDSIYNYCPKCGQENNDSNVSLGTLLHDFFSTYFAVDSKFAKTIKPFFIQPGFLTNKYTDGKRATYAHPLRLYLIISLFYFFVFSVIAKKSVMEEDKEVIEVSEDDIVQIEGLDDSTRLKLSEILPGRTVRKINKELDEDKDIEELRDVLEDLSDKDKRKLKKVFNDSTLNFLGVVFEEDTVRKEWNQYDYTKYYDDNSSKYMSDAERDSILNDGTLKENKEDGDFILNKINFKILNELKDNKKYSDQQILDSMKIDSLSNFEKHVALQTIRVNRADQEQVAGFIMKNLPLMMLILIPIFALILKLLYIRRNQLYIKHLIHALHLHSFAYLIYGISLLIMFYAIEIDDNQGWFGFLAFVGVSTYAYISFLKVYKQHWFKTLIKFNIVGSIYVMTIFIFFLLEMIISFLLY